MELSSIITNLGDHTRDAIVITEAEPIDLPGPKIVWVNKAFTEMTGYTPKEAIGQTPRILQGEDTSKKTRAQIRQALRAWKPIRINIKNYTKCGDIFWVDLDIKPVSDETGKYCYWVAIQRNITQQVAEQNKLKASLKDVLVLKERLALATEAAEIGIWEIYLNSNELIWDPVLRQMYGLDAEDKTDPREIWSSVMHPNDSARVENAIKDSIRTGEVFEEEFRIIGLDSTQKFIKSRAKVEFSDEGIPVRIIGADYDITEHKIREEELLETQKKAEHDATHDALTSLGNRRGARKYWNCLERKGKLFSQVAVLLIDLDRFKAINDRFGHVGGDFLLCSVANTLSEIVYGFGGGPKYIARLGGDEFLVILSGLRIETQAYALSAKILEACRKPVMYQGQKMHFGASIGVRVADSGTIDDFLDDADIALYAAKNSGRNGVQMFTPEIRNNAIENKKLSDNLIEALEKDQIGVRLQPQICSKSGKLFGVEALARWWNPVLGELTPELFLPIASELGILADLDSLVFQKALQSVHNLAEQGVFIPRLSVNISEQRLMHSKLLAELDMVKELQCLLSFELVESIDLTDPKAQFFQRIEALRDRGIQIEIDDFGSSHASLTTLLHLRPDCIKIDKQFTLYSVAMGSKPNILLQTICEMCQRLQIPVIAEGAENADITAMLKHLGCDVLQGNFYSAPLKETDFVAWNSKYLDECKSV